MHPSSFNAMKKLVSTHLNVKQPLKILDVGSYSVNGSYRGLFNSSNWEYVGLDIEAGPNVDIVVEDPYDWGSIGEFDLVVSGQCLEHVEFPWLTMEQIAKSLKPGGLHFNIVPSAGFIHRYPLDTYRYNPDGMVALAKWAGLEVVSIEGLVAPPWNDTVLVARKKEEDEN